MNELLPVVNGLVLGAIAGQYQAASRIRLVLLLCIAGAVVVTRVGQIYGSSTAFSLLDMMLIVISATVGLFATRQYTLSRRRG